MFVLKDFSVWLADKIVSFIGTWRFIVIQSLILTLWVLLNVFEVYHFDEYPFTFLNLFLSFEAAYATPLILMSANRSAERDRAHMLKDLQFDEETNIVIKKLAEDIRIDKTALDYIIKAKDERAEMREMLEEIKDLLKKQSID